MKKIRAVFGRQKPTVFFFLVCLGILSCASIQVIEVLYQLPAASQQYKGSGPSRVALGYSLNNRAQSREFRVAGTMNLVSVRSDVNRFLSGPGRHRAEHV